MSRERHSKDAARRVNTIPHVEEQISEFCLRHEQPIIHDADGHFVTYETISKLLGKDSNKLQNAVSIARTNGYPVEKHPVFRQFMRYQSFLEAVKHGGEKTREG